MKLFFAGASEILEAIENANVMLTFAYAKTQSKLFKAIAAERLEPAAVADSSDDRRQQEENKGD